MSMAVVRSRERSARGQEATKTATALVTLTHSLVLLGIESQAVVALRLGLLASGDKRAAGEAVTMVHEKVVAFCETHAQITTAILTGRGEQVADDAIHHYRSLVHANQTRLSST